MRRQHEKVLSLLLKNIVKTINFTQIFITKINILS